MQQGSLHTDPSDTAAGPSRVLATASVNLLPSLPWLPELVLELELELQSVLRILSK